MTPSFRSKTGLNLFRDEIRWMTMYAGRAGKTEPAPDEVSRTCKRTAGCYNRVPTAAQGGTPRRARVQFFPRDRTWVHPPKSIINGKDSDRFCFKMES